MIHYIYKLLCYPVLCYKKGQTEKYLTGPRPYTRLKRLKNNSTIKMFYLSIMNIKKKC